jgi:hypothetical protein
MPRHQDVRLSRRTEAQRSSVYVSHWTHFQLYAGASNSCNEYRPSTHCEQSTGSDRRPFKFLGLQGGLFRSRVFCVFASSVTTCRGSHVCADQMWRIIGVDTQQTGCTAGRLGVVRPLREAAEEPELLRGRLHWRREMLTSC